MIKFKGSVKKSGKKLLGFGISEANVRKLKEGMPILVNDPEFFDGEILIFYGRTEEEMTSEYLTSFLGPDTKIIKENNNEAS